MAEKDDLYKSEIEEVIGKLYRGDMTVMVYFLLKDTRDKDSLLEYLTGIVSEPSSDSSDVKIETPPSFKDWFNSFAEVE